eukprot:2819455-Amphidinium_carterae.1
MVLEFVFPWGRMSTTAPDEDMRQFSCLQGALRGLTEATLPEAHAIPKLIESGGLNYGNLTPVCANS